MSKSSLAPSRTAAMIILAMSSLIFISLIWLIYFNQGEISATATFDFLPALNATLNSLSALCLLAGFRAIKAGNRERHKRLMLSALIFSALFLISYVIYHTYHGDTPFLGTGIVRPVYYFILISHIVLSAVVLPFIFTTVYFAFKADFRRHPKIARITFPMWLYVSVTGVAIFFFLKAFHP